MGKVIRIFHELNCVGVRVRHRVEQGQTLLFESGRRTHTDQTVTASSIQVNRRPRKRVNRGEKCSIQVQDAAEFHHGMLIFRA